MTPEHDPLIFGTEEEQENYRSGVMDIMRAAVEEDRVSRRSQKPRDESPATLIGATGFPGGINQAL